MRHLAGKVFIHAEQLVTKIWNAHCQLRQVLDESFSTGASRLGPSSIPCLSPLQKSYNGLGVCYLLYIVLGVIILCIPPSCPWGEYIGFSG